MKKLLLLTMLTTTFTMSSFTIKADNRSVNFKEAFPNEALRNHIAMITQTDEDAEEISKDVLESIEDLDLRSNVQLESFKELELLPNLNDIMLRYQYKLKNLDGIGNFKNLKSLFIAYSSLESLENIQSVDTLEMLWVVNPSYKISELGDNVLEPLRNLNLTSLDLSNFGLTDSKVQVLKDMTSLERLVLSTGYQRDSDIPKTDWVLSVEAPLSNKLTNLDFVKNLVNLSTLQVQDNQLTDISGISGLKDTLTELSINTPSFGAPFSKVSSITDLSNVYVSDNYNNQGLTFAPMLTHYADEELKVDFENETFYVELKNLKTFNVIQQDGSIEKGRVALDENDIPAVLEEVDGIYRVSFKIKDAIPYRTGNKIEKVFEIDMFDKDQRHATFIYSVTMPSTKIIVKHLDEEGADLIDPEVLDNVYSFGEAYNIKPKDILNYTITEIPRKSSGVVDKEFIEIIFEYERASAGDVYVHHVDINNNPIDTDRLITGEKNIGLEYTTFVRDIPNYEVVVVPDNVEGVFTDEEQHVTYVYDLVSTDPTETPDNKEPIETPEIKVDDPKETTSAKTPSTELVTNLNIILIILLLSVLTLGVTKRKNI